MILQADGLLSELGNIYLILTVNGSVGSRGKVLPFTAIYERKSLSGGFTVPRQKRPIGYSI